MWVFDEYAIWVRTRAMSRQRSAVHAGLHDDLIGKHLGDCPKLKGRTEAIRMVN